MSLRFGWWDCGWFLGTSQWVSVHEIRLFISGNCLCDFAKGVDPSADVLVFGVVLRSNDFSNLGLCYFNRRFLGQKYLCQLHQRPSDWIDFISNVPTPTFRVFHDAAAVACKLMHQFL